MRPGRTYSITSRCSTIQNANTSGTGCCRPSSSRSSRKSNPRVSTKLGAIHIGLKAGVAIQTSRRLSAFWRRSFRTRRLGTCAFNKPELRCRALKLAVVEVSLLFSRSASTSACSLSSAFNAVIRCEQPISPDIPCRACKRRQTDQGLTCSTLITDYTLILPFILSYYSLILSR